MDSLSIRLTCLSCLYLYTSREMSEREKGARTKSESIIPYRKWREAHYKNSFLFSPTLRMGEPSLVVPELFGTGETTDDEVLD